MAKARGPKVMLCINWACPRRGLRYSRECAYATPMHAAVIAREGEWETQATGGYKDLPPHKQAVASGRALTGARKQTTARRAGKQKT